MISSICYQTLFSLVFSYLENNSIDTTLVENSAWDASIAEHIDTCRATILSNSDVPIVEDVNLGSDNEQLNDDSDFKTPLDVDSKIKRKRECGNQRAKKSRIRK